MIKYIGLILCCIALVFVLLNYSMRASTVANSEIENAFTLVAYDDNMYVYKENITDVMYIVYNSANRGGLTVMLNTDGTPLLYSEWKNNIFKSEK